MEPGSELTWPSKGSKCCLKIRDQSILQHIDLYRKAHEFEKKEIAKMFELEVIDLAQN